MSDVVAAVPEGRTRRRRVRRQPQGSYSFAELVYAHYLRQQALEKGRPYQGADEDRYRRFLACFEKENGTIVSAYWCRNEASGAAVTVRRAHPLLKAIGVADAVRLHRVTDWSTKDAPEIAELLHRIETLAVKAGEVLRDTSQRVALQWLFSSASYLLGFVDGVAKPDAKDAEKVVGHERVELAKVERYYRHAAVRSAHVVYLTGVLVSVVALLGIGTLAWLFWKVGASSPPVRTGFSCFTAGGVGALVSVMSRLASGKMAVDYDIGRDTLRVFGALRPVIGAFFGLAAFFALESGIVNLKVANETKTFAFYVFFAFLAGFSERWAQDMLLGAGRGLVPRREEPPPPGPSRNSKEPEPPV
jgi:hypothetical protein